MKKKWVSIDSVPSFVKDNPQESEASNSDGMVIIHEASNALTAVDTAVEALERNQKYGVDNGDVLFLLPDEYALEVHAICYCSACVCFQVFLCIRA